MRILTLTLSSAFIISGCVTKPDALAPASQQSITAGKFDAKQPPTPELVDSLSKVFRDSTLDSIVQQAVKNNPDLRTSLARLDESSFNMTKANAPLLPSLSANVGGARQDMGLGTNNQFNATLDASWEVDIWGKIRSGSRASAADYYSTAASYEAAKQSIAAQTMQAWFDLASAEQSVDLATRRYQSFQTTEKLVDNRFVHGTGGLADVDLAKTETLSSKSSLESQRNLRDQAARNVRVLTGSYPDASLTAKAKLPSLRRSVKAGIPSDVMLNRPDIVAAYQAIVATDERVNVAYADLFPSFTLTASGGQNSNSLGDLAKSGFSVWSVAGNFAAPLFDAGQRRAELGASAARAEQAYFSYQSTVLSAFREVENALGSERYLASQLSATEQALTAAKRAEEKTMREYEDGLVDILQLLITQRTVFNTEEQVIQLRAARAKNRVSLALALGKAY